MITESILLYLDNKENDIEKKYEFIKRLNLSYADLYDLREMYRHDSKIYRLLDSFCYYYCNTNSLETKINKERKENKNRVKKKKSIRKYKRRYNIYD